MYLVYLRGALALCLTGLLAASLDQETHYGEQTDTVKALRGDQRSIREVHNKQFFSRRTRESAYDRRRRLGEHNIGSIISLLYISILLI